MMNPLTGREHFDPAGAAHWLTAHVEAVAGALFDRLCRPESASRRWQMYFYESEPGMRGGITVVPADEQMIPAWQPVPGVFADMQPGALTREQIAHRLAKATHRLPVLDPTEE